MRGLKRDRSCLHWLLGAAAGQDALAERVAVLAREPAMGAEPRAAVPRASTSDQINP